MSATDNGIGIPSPGRRSRRKGARAELGLIAALHARGWTRCRRNFASGAAGGGDIVGGPAGIHWECKHVETLNIWKALSQAELDANPAGNTPVVAFRRNRSKWYAVLELDELLALLQLRDAA